MNTQPQDDFDKAMAFVAKWEGGFIDHPSDRGGRTNLGVTQKVYDSWRRKQGHDPRDVLHITDAEVHAIYRQSYWDTAKCGMLRNALNLIHFDTAVNSGPTGAVKLLQRALKCPADGAFGPVTAKAAAECDVPAAMKEYCDLRERFYRRIVERHPGQKVFLKGWLNRLHDLRMEAGVIARTRSRVVDFGDADYIARVPYLEDGDTLEDWV